MKKLYDEIFKTDSKGKIRTWRMEQNGHCYRTIAGIFGGNLVTSEWTECDATNVGRANERSPNEQATFEIEAAYEKKLTREYHKTITSTAKGAHYIKPMLAGKYDPNKFVAGYAQPKLDGIRCIATKDGLWSREGKKITGVEHIEKALEKLFQKKPDAILDGELYNHEYRNDFDSIVSAVKKKNPTAAQKVLAEKIVQYHVYDVPSYNNTFVHRNAWLKTHLSMLHNSIILVDTIPCKTKEDYDAAHWCWLGLEYEGSIYRLDQKYQNKRSKYLLKRKEFFDEEYPVSRILEGEGNWAGYAKAVEYILPGDQRTENGERPKAGIKGNQDFCKRLLKEKHNVVTIRFPNKTPGGIPRFPVATKFHGNKRVY